MNPRTDLVCGCFHSGGEYERFVTTIIAAVDPSRTIAPHSPMPDGWSSGVDRLTTRPKLGQPLVAGVKPEGIGRPINFSFGMEGHGPYVTAPYAGNQSGYLETPMPMHGPLPHPVPNSSMPVGDGFYHAVAAPSWTGPQYEGWFESEFGAVSWPSFESASSTLPKDQWGLGSAVPSRWRNWNPAALITAMFGTNATADTHLVVGEAAFKRQLYQSQVCAVWGVFQGVGSLSVGLADTHDRAIGDRAVSCSSLLLLQIAQALLLKTEIEAWRSTNNFGTLFWMFNEIWPTVSITYPSLPPPALLFQRPHMRTCMPPSFPLPH